MLSLFKMRGAATDTAVIEPFHSRPSVDRPGQLDVAVARERGDALGLILLFLGMGLLIRLAFLAIHPDVDWEPDGYNHVNLARSVFEALPGSLWIIIDVWAKPLYTALFAILYAVTPSSWPPLVVTQVANAVFWTGAAGLTLSIARRLFPGRAALGLLAAISAFTYVTFRASVSANTEPLGALIFALGLWLWHRGAMRSAMLALGALILVRTDAVFCVVVYPLWAMTATLIDSGKPMLARLRTAFYLGVMFSLPLAMWNLLGFIHTGSLLYVLTHGYPSASGIYGYGKELHYLTEFLKFDTVLFLLTVMGVVLVALRARQLPGLVVASAAAVTLYFVSMSVMWSYGAFGSAGLLRYFAFCYPAWILAAGVAAQSGQDWLERCQTSAVMPVTAALILVVVLQLHWLVREPHWHHGLLTRVPDNRAQTLPQLDLPWRQLPVYTDRPDARYYLGHTLPYSNAHRLGDGVRNPAQPGIFIFSKGWSESYSGVREEDFTGMTEKARVPGPDGSVFQIYQR